MSGLCFICAIDVDFYDTKSKE